MAALLEEYVAAQQETACASLMIEVEIAVHPVVEIEVVGNMMVRADNSENLDMRLVFVAVEVEMTGWAFAAGHTGGSGKVGIEVAVERKGRVVSE